MRKQEQIAAAREEIERQRKLLGKKRPSLSTSKSKSGNGSSLTLVSAITIPGNVSCSPLSSVSTNASTSLSNGDFLKPESPKDLNWYEYYEQDEILKLRSQALKKEDTDLQLELEKLERERNLHIRELKRIHNEDQSRFNNHQTLNDRYLLLILLGKGWHRFSSFRFHSLFVFFKPFGLFCTIFSKPFLNKFFITLFLS